jgi:crotonobetainyl-CoA:carnitine CoA-transferase CaiB-like acyl-CoA transferase
VSQKTMLEGIKVLDLTTVVFGPYCTQILADLGAEVIKIEPSEGDMWRRVASTPEKTPMMGPGHLRLNRGKRSVVLDMNSPSGKESVQRLIARSDIFIHNIRAEAITRLGLTYDAARAIRSNIIYVHGVGFGSGGPYAGLQAYDDLIQAGAGVTSLLPRVDGNPKPRFLPMLMADKVSGLYCVYAVLAALFHRERTGEGQHVEVPMFEVMTDFVLLEHLAGMTFVPPTGPAYYHRQIDPLRQPLETKDGWIAIAPYIDTRWIKFFEVAGRSELLDDARLATPELRLQNMSLMYELAVDIMPAKTTAEWLTLLAGAHIPAMRVNSVEDLLNDPHLEAVGTFKKRTHPSEGEYLEMRPPVRFSAREYPEPRHASRIGQDTDDVLSELEADVGVRASVENAESPGRSRSR